MNSTVKRIVCPTEPDPCNGAEGCGWEFGYVDDDLDDDYLTCPKCGLYFDIERAPRLVEYDKLAQERVFEDLKRMSRDLHR